MPKDQYVCLNCDDNAAHHMYVHDDETSKDKGYGSPPYSDIHCDIHRGFPPIIGHSFIAQHSYSYKTKTNHTCCPKSSKININSRAP